MTENSPQLTAAQHEELVRADLHDWQKRLSTAQEAQYSDVRDSAEKWSGALAVLIGAVGSISVLVVPKALEDFSNQALEVVTFALAGLAGLLGLAALGLALRVAYPWPKIDATMDALKYKEQTINGAVAGVRSLGISRWLTMGAVVCIVAAGIISQADTLTAKSSGVNVLVVHRDGSTTCAAIADAAKYTDAVTTTSVAHC